MRIRWRDLELPTKVVADSATRTDMYAKFTAEPFERGYGTTIGNALRRVLLASLEGSAVTAIRVEGIGVPGTDSPLRSSLQGMPLLTGMTLMQAISNTEAAVESDTLSTPGIGSISGLTWLSVPGGYSLTSCCMNTSDKLNPILHIKGHTS